MDLGASKRPGRYLRAAAALVALGALAACGDDNPTSSNPCALSRAAAIQVGQSLTGNLASSDCHLPDGSYGDLYKLTVATGQTVSISLASGAFSPYVVLEDANGAEVASTGPGSGSGQAVLNETLAAGTYYIVANSVNAGETGSYTLSLTAACGTGGATSIALGNTVNGSLAASDCVLDDGTYADVYRLTVGSTQNVQIDLSSSAFDAYIFLWDASGTPVAAADGGGPGNDARLILSLPAGTYYVVANAYNVGETGSYTLKVQASASAPCTLSGATTITLGTTTNGSLSTTDCVLQDGSYADVYQFSLGTSRAVQVDMASGAVDSYLILIDASGSVIGQDDDSGGGSNARITTPTLSAGTYYVIANSFSPGETGAYTLTLAP